MNINTTIAIADTLEKELDQTGHLWFVEDRVRAATREELKDGVFLHAFIYDLYILIGNQWNIRTNIGEVDELVADLAVRIHNIDLDGRTADLPPHRAQVLGQ